MWIRATLVRQPTALGRYTVGKSRSIDTGSRGFSKPDDAQGGGTKGQAVFQPVCDWDYFSPSDPGTISPLNSDQNQQPPRNTVEG